MISIGICFLQIQILNILKTFTSMSVFYFRHATMQCLDVMRTTGDHKIIALDLTSRERNRITFKQKKRKEIIYRQHSNSFKTYVLETPQTSDPHTTYALQTPNTLDPHTTSLYRLRRLQIHTRLRFTYSEDFRSTHDFALQTPKTSDPHTERYCFAQTKLSMH